MIPSPEQLEARRDHSKWDSIICGIAFCGIIACFLVVLAFTPSGGPRYSVQHDAEIACVSHNRVASINTDSWLVVCRDGTVQPIPEYNQ